MPYTYAYPRPMVTADAVVFGVRGDVLEVLLVERKREPFAGRWALPGGFVDIDEDLGVAVRRELAEEAGLSDLRLAQFGVFGAPGRDPRGRTITVAYTALTVGADHAPEGGDDAARAQWHPMTDMPPVLAFDHGNIVTYALAQLQEWTLYKGVGAGILEPRFRLRELAHLYGLICGEPVRPEIVGEHVRFMNIAHPVPNDPGDPGEQYEFVPTRLAPV